ncbi:MAG: FAD-dependent oxidoreductase [Candidatus Thermoplasmatota archaeon]|jgi:NADPH-dependent glutamate synthase beta subunit-like oxidoreductase|nr:FAD-dependent oxidoreductase [Candidatus Thermoplasmatota archaeon]MCL5955388.1 FAD-dependent oxidoreductase [Candidatus Thermoplasmatota archaeon]
MLNFERVKIAHEDPQKRVKSFRLEAVKEYSDSEAIAESSRCIGCNICTQACPASLDIGGYINSTAVGDPAQTVRIVFENLPFPAVIGRVCTHLCEDICVMYDTGGPIAIRHIKRYAADKFNDYGEILQLPRKKFIGKKVAVIGGGPSGLTASYYLSIQGIKVALFEKLPALGGFMKTGIPRYRLPQEVIDKEIGFIISQGVDVKLNTEVGKDITFDEILKSYDAVYISVGNQKPHMTGTPGSDAVNVIHATEFLRRVSFGEHIDVGKNVVVIGGGFTANDSSRTSMRLGANNVYIMYRRREIDRPGYPSMNADEEMEESIEEYVHYVWEVTPFEYVKEGNRAVKLRYWQNEMVTEKGGRARPVPNKDKVHEIDVDFIIEATGQETDYGFMGDEYLRNLRLTPQGQPITNETGMTSLNGVFSGGDSTNASRDLISAVRDADKAVNGILGYLNVMDQVNEDRLPILDRWKKFSPTSAKMAYAERTR